MDRCSAFWTFYEPVILAFVASFILTAVFLRLPGWIKRWKARKEPEPDQLSFHEDFIRHEPSEFHMNVYAPDGRLVHASVEILPQGMVLREDGYILYHHQWGDPGGAVLSRHLH